jgi:hypothetical protein
VATHKGIRQGTQPTSEKDRGECPSKGETAMRMWRERLFEPF